MISGPVNRCRVCGQPFLTEPLVRYANMPCAAQNLPDAASVADDVGSDLEVCQCSGCGLVQLSSEPVAYHREVIRAAGISGEMTAFRRQQFADFMHAHALKGKKVVEIGSGGGEYLAVLDELPLEAVGLEYSQELVAKASGNGLCLTQGFVEDQGCQLPGAPYDGFLMLSFLEHLPDPNSVLRGICNNLADGAVGLVEVPNFDMILQEKMFAEFISDHLTYFTRETLQTTLCLNGFDLLECRPVWHDYILSVQVRKRSRKDIGGFSEFQARLHRDVEGFITRYGVNNVAIWGAGHQALSVMSLLELGDKIRYVVDSAPFKQDKFTSATHIPIVAPTALESDPVDAVIVMAASYSDEVVALLRQHYRSRMQVAVLRNHGLEVL